MSLLLKKTTVLLLIISVLSINFLSCASIDDSDEMISEQDQEQEPEAYSDEEFPGWLNELRRAEIIFAGTIPLSVLLSSLGYNVYRTVTDNSDSGADAFSSFLSSTDLSNDENMQIMIISLGLSATAALADFIIGLFEKDE